MCGRFTLISPGEVLAEFFELVDTPIVEPRYNIAPTQLAPVVRFDANMSARRLDCLQWGLVPHWAKDPSIGSRMINARSETAAEKPSFRSAMKHRRCMVVTNGFYEWRKGEGREPKQPFFIQMKDGGPFAMAGLWEQWKGRDGSIIDSCTILTTEPNDLMRPLHDRMPVILNQIDYATWLDPKTQTAPPLAPLFRPYAADAMKAHAVTTYVNKPANDSPVCIQSIEIPPASLFEVS